MVGVWHSNKELAMASSIKFKRIESATPSGSQVDELIKWNICILCHKDTPETLICPARKNGVGYKYVAENLKSFSEIGERPFCTPVLRLLMNKIELETALRTNHACWHKSCRSRIGTTVLLRKRKNESQPASPAKTRRLTASSQELQDVCFFCNKSSYHSSQTKLHNVQTLEMDCKVRKQAALLKDLELLRKLAPGDMVATESKYHKNCLAAFCRRKPVSDSVDSSEDSLIQIHSLALAELVAYIENFCEAEDDAPVFSMPFLSRLYSSSVKKLGLEDGNVHSTRLRNKLLEIIPGLTSAVQDRETVLMFDKDIGEAVKRACKESSEAVHLSKAAQQIRRDILQSRKGFDGKFTEKCQKDSIPSSLKTLIKFILCGSTLTSDEIDTSKAIEQAVLSVSQLIAFNCKQSCRLSTFQRHNQKNETPLPLYLSLKVHAETRKRGLVDTLFALGLGISYDRVLSISSEIADQVCSSFERAGVVVPPQMRKGVFTTAAFDNIDHNPSSMTAVDSLHGTSVSLTQHRKTEEEGQEQGVLVSGSKETPPEKKTIPQLPVQYVAIMPVPCPGKEQTAPHLSGPCKPCSSTDTGNYETEYAWLRHVYSVVETAPISDKDFISWAAYHASCKPSLHLPVADSFLLPLLLENAHSPALVKHVMGLIKSTVEYLNPTQKPVIAADQPLYALAKEIQWTWPDTHGEQKCVLMLGGLHIEMSAFKTLGDWLNGSGWTSLLTAAGIATSGVADSFLKASHLTRTRHAHQVTAAALYILLQRAFKAYMEASPAEQSTDMQEWQDRKSKEQPQFKY